MLKIQIHDKNGTKNEIIKQCGHSDGEVNLRKLHESCIEMQSEVNSVLSVYVEQERSQGITNTANNEEDDEEDESEDDDMDTNTCNGPAEKKLKT
ncbi:hypothetical protein FSP39_010036 [Pinctada imbricata]|uniref:Uncharacterized protein n=1 Tax=Pinctada imbricata TaxID=66713 RepID=A0AA88XW61_PINIB|nr:hypothetical protein FSP39_010036 [Pinctada imbricata]